MSFSGRLFAQDAVFSQFYSSPVQLNPAFVGTTYSPKVALNYRNQWSSIFNAYVTYAASFDQFSEKLNSGFGFSAIVDQAGDGVYNTGGFSVIYSYRIPVGDKFFIKGGVQAGLRQVSVDWDRLTFLDQLDPIGGPILTTGESRPDLLNRQMFDLSTGVLLYSDLFYGGFSAYHLNTPDQSLLGSNDQLTDGLPMRFSIHGGMQISLNKPNAYNKGGVKTFVSPNILYTNQGGFSQVNMGAYLGLGQVYGGVWYRHASSNPDAAIFLIGYNKSIFKIGYSY
ncbi:MAG: PorP/SprF family type IX secretion system membrane protein, partial [Saprospiraceae bacterium]